MNVAVRRCAQFAAVLWIATLFAVPLAAAVENETFGIKPEPDEFGGNERSGFSVPREVGAVFEDSIKIFNRSDSPLELAVYATDADADPNGQISVGFRGTETKGVGAWIDLEDDNVTLPARGETTLSFRVEIRSSDPKPDLGAIVVENTARGLAADLAERLNLVVRTDPPGSPTTSERVRPLLLQSPWVIIAILGLIGVVVLVWIGWRRARRPKDEVVPAGEADEPEAEVEAVPEASRPVLRRLGALDADGDGPDGASNDGAFSDEDERPLLDDLLVEVEDVPGGVVEKRPPPRRKRAARKRPAKRTAASTRQADIERRNYIPLDEL